jgi:YidC/Oxa1 family membrane protein insertase
MDNEARRIVVALFVAMAVFIAYQYVVSNFLPPPPPGQPATATAPASTETAPTSGPVAASSPNATGTTAPATAATVATRNYAFSSADNLEPVELGGRTGDALRLELRPRGAGISTLQLYAQDQKGRFVHRTKPHENAPYQLLSPVDDGQRDYGSFATSRIWIEQRGDETWNQSWPLDNLTWMVVEKSPAQAVFTTTLATGEPGGELLRLTKRFTLRPGKPIFDLELTLDNISTTPLKVRVEQDGPLGLRQENQQYDMRKLLTAQRTASGVELGKGRQYAELQKASADPNVAYLALIRPDKGPFLWAALADKFFAVYTRPLPTQGSDADYVAAVNGLVVAPSALAQPGDTLAHGDLLARIVTKSALVPAGASLRYPFEVYAGAKDADSVGAADPAYADPQQLYYQVAKSADISCFCTFLWLQDLMLWLLERIYLIVRNYGIAIIILVIIVRTLLHPLSVWQQKSMFRTQEAMARVQPKMTEIKAKYANDKVKQNQETMKLFHEEGVNPAGGFVSMLPMFIQMPILVALWSALNTDAHLRHAPFDGWWIVDLSAPDALLSFNPPLTVPILGQLPLLGSVFAGITSFNLLPLLLALVMYLQQKYMPKPQVQAHQAAPRAGQASSGKTAEDQIRQQKMMAWMMVVLFPLMFYKMPSGLNLYWFASNIFGIGESLIIRKQINEERRRRELAGPQPRKPKSSGLVGRFFKHVVEQAEQLQHKADSITKTDEPRKGGKKKP